MLAFHPFSVVKAAGSTPIEPTASNGIVEVAAGAAATAVTVSACVAPNRSTVSTCPTG